MATEGHVPNPPSARRLLGLSAIALVIGSIVVLGFILPAEYHIDLTGFGRLTGLNRLAGPEEIQVSAPVGATPIAPETATAFRTDTIDISLEPGGSFEGSELEYKVGMKAGDVLVYSWEVPNPPPADEFYYDFHSQSDPDPKVRVLSHKATTGAKESGALTAPFNGIHGWYFQNQSEGKVTVHLRLAGFYHLLSAKELAAAEAAAPPPDIPIPPLDSQPQN